MVFILSFLIGIFIIVLFIPLNNTALNHDFRNLLKAVDEKNTQTIRTTDTGLLDRISLLGTRILKLFRYELSSQKRKE